MSCPSAWIGKRRWSPGRGCWIYDCPASRLAVCAPFRYSRGVLPVSCRKVRLKLDKQILAQQRDIFSAMGIQFHLNCEIGRDRAFAGLLADYDAVFLGVGTYGLMKAGLEHEDAPGVVQALPFLIASTRRVSQAMTIVKCDLCTSRESGPACVDVCPTSALKKQSAGELLRLGQLRRTAKAFVAGVVWG